MSAGLESTNVNPQNANLMERKMNSSVLIKNSHGRFIDFKGSPNLEKNTCNETLWSLPAYFGQGTFTNIRLHSDMDMCLSHCSLKKNYQAKIEQSTPMITFAFSISGKTCTNNASHKNSIIMEGGDSYVHFFQDTVFHRKIFCKDKVKALVIRITPRMFEKIMINDLYEADKAHESMLSAIKKNNFFSSHKTTTEMKVILFQIFNCSSKGIVRKIFLESKAMELIAHKIEQISFKASAPQKTISHMGADDRERIYSARRLLLKNLKYPPSLPDLAKSVGISHTKLNRNFRRIFGYTVFDYLRKERLEYGRLLLCENSTSITDIAFEAGFCSSSHFASAFLKQFGVRPNTYRKNNGGR